WSSRVSRVAADDSRSVTASSLALVSRISRRRLLLSMGCSVLSMGCSVSVSVMADFDPVTKAVVPAAGLGTRFLPATKATPKEMLPLVDKPAIQYVVEEAVSAGLLDVLMVPGRNKRSIEDHFDVAYELEDALRAKGDQERLSQVQEPVDLAIMHYVRQGEPKGLGHAVLCAKQHVGNEPFACLLGDDLIDPRDPLLKRMIEARSTYGGSVIALMEVPRE